MGVTILNALALLQAKAEGARFERTLMLGRLACFMGPRDLRRVVQRLPADSAFARDVREGRTPTYMDDFFRALGATTLDALDASAFEGATVIHDLNEPLPEHLLGQYDAVVDGGTLEHVFNLPAAFKNAMDALAVGGRFFAAPPANNYCGHGFYQFSAELFYRVFSAENGFEIERLLVAPAYASGKWLDGPAFQVADPDVLRDRVNIGARGQLLFLVQARKTAQVPVFTRWPQQSDYVAHWAGPDAAAGAPSRTAMRTIRYLAGRAGGVGRLAVRLRERWLWRRTAGANPALTRHDWPS
jgi:SAM-dependent methyltransferase